MTRRPPCSWCPALALGLRRLGASAPAPAHRATLIIRLHPTIYYNYWGTLIFTLFALICTLMIRVPKRDPPWWERAAGRGPGSRVHRGLQLRRRQPLQGLSPPLLGGCLRLRLHQKLHQWQKLSPPPPEPVSTSAGACLHLHPSQRPSPPEVAAATAAWSRRRSRRRSRRPTTCRGDTHSQSPRSPLPAPSLPPRPSRVLMLSRRQ